MYINWTNSLKDKLLKLMQGETDSLDSPLPIEEIETIMSNLAQKKT